MTGNRSRRLQASSFAPPFSREHARASGDPTARSSSRLKKFGDVCSVLKWVVCIGLFFATFARAEITGVLARGQGERLFIVRTDKGEKDQTFTSVRRLVDPVRGTWAEMYRPGGKFSDVAVLDERLALLAEDGSWQVVWQGGGVAGPLPDGDQILRRLASDGYDTIWAIATRPGKIGDLLKWTETAGWSTVLELPEEADLPDVSLGVFDGVPWLACGTDKQATVLKLNQKDGASTWQKVFTTAGLKLPHPQAWVSGVGRPLLVSRGADQQLSLQRIEPTGQLVRLNPMPENAAAWTVAGPSVRIITIGNDRLLQTTIDRYGAGATFGPEPIADPAPPLPQSRLEWLNTLLLIGLTFAMLRALNSDTAEPPAAYKTGWQLAPIWRRASAGIIDALPLLIGVGWVAYRQEHPMNEEAVRLAVYLPMYLASLIYIGHVSATELAFGRSVGKWVCGLKVISEDGERASTGQIIARNVLRLLEWPLLLPIFLPLFSPNRQRVGDLAAKTLVVLKDPKPVDPAS